MDLGGFKLFAMLSRRMDWLGDRSRMLAQNVANADTPRYVAKDLAPIDFRRALGGGTAPLRTDPAHLVGRAAGAHAIDHRQGRHGVTLSGNAVDLEGELQKVGETAVEYQEMVNLYRKHLDLLKIAIGRGSG